MTQNVVDIDVFSAKLIDRLVTDLQERYYQFIEIFKAFDIDGDGNLDFIVRYLLCV